MQEVVNPFRGEPDFVFDGIAAAGRAWKEPQR